MHLKNILPIFYLCICMTFASCTFSNQTEATVSTPADTLQAYIDSMEKERLQKIREWEEIEYHYSIRLEAVLQDALKMAGQHFDKNSFRKEYDILTDSDFVRVDINLDHHFTKATPHLIIKRTDAGKVYIDIYSKDEKAFQKVISHIQENITYVNDTIRDINGDGLKDFVVNWYGSAGCCLKGFSNVYLLRSGEKEFSANLEFINPTFSPKEKMIRGICYGQPGETEMYKFKWNGETVDTLEYVSYERSAKGKTGKILITDRRPYDDQYKVLKTLRFPPLEYRNIEGYVWFVGPGLK